VGEGNYAGKNLLISQFFYVVDATYSEQNVAAACKQCQNVAIYYRTCTFYGSGSPGGTGHSSRVGQDAQFLKSFATYILPTEFWTKTEEIWLFKVPVTYKFPLCHQPVYHLLYKQHIHGIGIFD